MNHTLPPIPVEVQAVFDACPDPARRRLLTLRALIFATAERTAGVGPLEEALRWGEAAYLPTRTRSGSAVRLGWQPTRPEQVVVLFHCQTGLVERFRTMFPRELTFEGQRAIVLPVADPFDGEALSCCIAASLRHHLDRRRSRS
jgi:hypothetical protein